jgi:hypothetical protein
VESWSQEWTGFVKSPSPLRLVYSKPIRSVLIGCVAGALLADAAADVGQRVGQGVVSDGQGQGDAPEYLTGRTFRERLDMQVSARYRNVPLRRVLYGLTHDGGVALVLDRRIDPSVLVDRRSAGLSRRELLEELAGAHGGELTVVGDVLYMAPPAAARRMDGLIDRRRRELAALPAARRRALRGRWNLRWHDLDAPEQILARIAEHYDFKLEGTERVPWDLWARSALPQTTAVEQLSLVLGQFDLTFQWEDRGEVARIISIPANELGVLTAPRRAPRNRSARRRIRPERGQAVFTASPKNVKLEAALQGLAGEAGCALSVDWEALRASGVEKDSLISFTAKRNTLEAVLHKILDPLHVTFEVADEHIYVPARAKR